MYIVPTAWQYVTSYSCNHSVFYNNYVQTNLESPSAEILSEQHEDSLSSIPVPISASSMPTICDSIVVEQECYEHFSDDDSETYCTPPTSPTSPNEVSCQ